MRGALRENTNDIFTGFNDGWPLKSCPGEHWGVTSPA
jgi:hypothetical protein